MMNFKKINFKYLQPFKNTIKINKVIFFLFFTITSIAKTNNEVDFKHASKENINIIVTGIVIASDNNQPLPGVSIVIKGTNKSTITDLDGKYTITADNKDNILVFSYVGFTVAEMTIGPQTIINVSLSPDTKQLQEVVVVGYGSIKRSQVLGAVSSVSLKESSSRTYNSTAELLQGTVAGVTILNNGGDPTAPPSINIRGIGSLNTETPLIVLDGIVYSGSFNNINPNDIESISVLKDAASAAIYGARASGGVILITTKKGTPERMRINVNYQGGMQQVAKKLVALDATEYADAMNLATDNAGLPRVPAFNVANEPSARTTNTVWMDKIFQIGEVQDLTLSIDGGSDKSSFFLSGGYRRSEGILLNTYANRYTARANGSYKLSSNVTIGENMNYSLTNGQSGNTTSGYTGSILSAIFYPPNATVYRQDGSGAFGGVPEKYAGSYGDVINPVAYLKRLDINNPITNILFNPYFDWKITKGITFKSNWGYTYIQDNAKQFNTKITEPGKIFDFNQLIQNSSTVNDLLAEQTISFDKRLAKHNFNAILGYTYQKTKREYYSILATGFENEDASQRYIINAKSIQQNGAGQAQDVLISYLGRITYDYNNKYLLSAIVRRDGTSKLTAANRWKVYPSISLGWLVTEEPFMQSLSPILTNLKLRGSFGQIGNLGSLGPYQFSVPLTQSTSLFGNSPVINYGFSERELSNPSLVWESSEQKNIGIDFGIFDNTLNGSIDAFVKTNKDMLVRDQLPGVAGSPLGRIVNAGNVENRGLEGSINYKNKIGSTQFDFAINVAFLDNKIVSIKDNLTTLEPLNAPRVRSLPLSNIYEVGSPVGAFYGFQTDGLFQTDAQAKAYVNNSGTIYQPAAKAGDFKFKDTNADGVINNNDRVVLGNPFPKNTFSFNANIKCRAIDFNIFFQGVSGNKIFNAVKYTGVNASFPGYNLLADAKDAWTPDNPNATIPKLSASDPNNNFGRITDFYIEDASFLRLKNISIGYTVNNKCFNGKATLRFYVSGQNVFTITKYSGMDPEVGLNNYGIDLGRYPLSKIYMSGLNVTF
jgi:TonB-dependent starch-binding outer membrane protein SusC